MTWREQEAHRLHLRYRLIDAACTAAAYVVKDQPDEAKRLDALQTLQAIIHHATMWAFGFSDEDRLRDIESMAAGLQARGAITSAYGENIIAAARVAFGDAAAALQEPAPLHVATRWRGPEEGGEAAAAAMFDVAARWRSFASDLLGRSEDRQPGDRPHR